MEKSIKKYWPIFVLPTFAAFIIGFIVPFIEGIYLSFCKFTTIRDASFVGLSNYVEAFKDNTFTHAFGFTAVFAVVTLVLINVLAFAIALALTQKIKGTNIFRTIFFMPNLIGGIVLGYIWQLIFDGIFEKFDLALKLSAKLGFWGLVILICWQQIVRYPHTDKTSFRAVPSAFPPVYSFNAAEIIFSACGSCSNTSPQTAFNRLN